LTTPAGRTPYTADFPAMKRPAVGLHLALLLVLPAASFGAVEEPSPVVRNPVTHVLLAPAETQLISAVRAADDERVGAILAADRARLDAILSDQLRYTHSNGSVDTKQTFIEALVTRGTVYETCDYLLRDFHPASADIVLMTGRMNLKARSTAGSFASEVSLLGVWRLEDGRWRFLAWQSAKLTPPPAPAPAAK
jgi:hypothetical protein